MSHLTPQRVPELDALRAFAAAVVLLFHLDPLRFFPGWSGVDLFFVLSGYLITSIILRNGTTPGFFGRFYARRTLRIWPTYYLVLIGLVVVNPYLANPEPLGSLPYALTFTQNLPLYWGKQPPLPIPAFDHAWTLAIEEQFYLVWPALVVSLGRRRLVLLCLITIALAMAAREGNNWIIPRYAERLLLSRSDGFALGGLLAWSLDPKGWARQRPDRARWVFGGSSLSSLAYLFWGSWCHGPLGFIGLPTPMDPAETIFAFGLLYAGVIGLVVVEAGKPWLAPLRFRGFVYLGQISYGLYLYHVVVYWVMDGCRIQQPLLYHQPWPTQAGKVLGSVAMAVVSWHLIERPVLAWKDRVGYREPRVELETRDSR